MMAGGVLVLEDFLDDVDPAAFQARRHADGVTYHGIWDEDDEDELYDVTAGEWAQDRQYAGCLTWKTAAEGGVVLSATINLYDPVGDEATRGGFIIRASTNAGNLTTDNFGLVLLHNAAPGGNCVYVYLPSGTESFDAGDLNWDADHELVVHDTGTRLKIYVDGALVTDYETDELGGNDYYGIFYHHAAGGRVVTIDDFQMEVGVYSQQPPERKLVVVSGGSIYGGLHDSGLDVATDGAGALSVAHTVRMAEAFGFMFFADGTAAGYKYFDPTDDSIHDWDGDPPDAFSGSLPVGIADATLGCPIITLYRGRVVLAGLYENPNEWYMSAVGDPFDFDYGAAIITPTQAVAATLADAGKIGDVVTCLMPYSDDIMIFGCSQSLWALQGDPAAGGMIDAISYKIGIAGADAATRDELGNLYFYGSGGVWVMKGGVSQPVSLTDGRLKGTFSGFDLELYRIQLIWDRMAEGLYVFLLPADLTQPSTADTHWFWDRKTDSWWKVEFPVAHGPSFAHHYPADNADDRALLLGGWDSKIRYLSPTAKDDDGTVITSYADFTPISVGGDFVNTRFSEIQVLMAEGSDPAVLRVYRGTTPEAAATTTALVCKRQVVAGRNPAIFRRITANALRLRLGSIGDAAQRWTMEGATAILEPRGRARRR